MLNDLKVVNGILSPKYDKEVYDYVVHVDEDVISLVLDYDVENASITIYGNDYLTSGENHVLLEIYSDKLETYTLTVYKDASEQVISYEDDYSAVEVTAQDRFVKDLITPGISVICFLTIVILFCFIFKKK